MLCGDDWCSRERILVGNSLRPRDSQVNDDEGAPAVLNGFLGRAFGIGPIVTYSTKLGKSHLDFSARWIPF